MDEVGLYIYVYIHTSGNHAVGHEKKYYMLIIVNYPFLRSFI